MPNMKDLSLRVKKFWPMLEVFDGQTDRRTKGTDRVITIGHRPSGGALINHGIHGKVLSQEMYI